MHNQTIIVGAGLAGTTLALHLMVEGENVLIYDEFKSNSASRVAAGLANPITGKRLVKSWLIDELLNYANTFYHEVESQFNCQIKKDIVIDRIIPNPEILAQWENNLIAGRKEGFIGEENGYFIKENLTDKPFFQILKGFKLDVQTYLEVAHKYFHKKAVFIPEKFTYSSLEVKGEIVTFKGQKPKRIIFCEGIGGVQNTFFSNLPFNPNKGELVTVRSTALNHKNVIKHNVFILPLYNHIYKVGATYDRVFTNDKPSDKGLAYLLDKTKKSYSGNLEILSHEAAIRPATIDRRPFIGVHDTFNQLFMFNGFGAKGVLLIPFFAHLFTQHLLEGVDLPKEVNPYR